MDEAKGLLERTADPVEDCLVGTEHQQCTEGQGRVMVGVGLAITVPSALGLLVTVLRRRTY